MSITAKYNHVFSGEIDLKNDISSTVKKGDVMPLSPVQTFGGKEIIDSITPFSKTGVYIIGEGGSVKATGSGSLTVTLYSAGKATDTMEVVGTFGPYDTADINADKPFLRVALPENAKGCIQIGVSGTAFTAGKAIIRVEA